ncbi:unnamed protein product, partial [Callosobruchus maculatus]
LVESAVESHFHSYPTCRSKNRSTQNFELLHSGLLTLFLDDYRALSWSCCS